MAGRYTAIVTQNEYRRMAEDADIEIVTSEHRGELEVWVSFRV